MLLAQGRPDDAAQCYRRALALKPELAEAHNNLGIVLAAQGDLVEACRSHLAPYKVPVRFERVGALPRNDLGKVMKRDLLAGLAGPQTPAS